MLKSKKIKQFSMVLLLPVLFMAFVFINPKNSYASITDNGGGNYTVTCGDDLWDLLSDSNHWWSGEKGPFGIVIKPSHQVPQNMYIKVDGKKGALNVSTPITLPSSTNKLYYGIKNVNVDFNNQPFFVDSPSGSNIDVSNATNNPHLTLSNVNIEAPSSNIAPWLSPNPDGTILRPHAEYYTTSNGLLFSSNSNNISSNNATITYKNINYNCPTNLGYNQPFATGATPIEFQGTNTIISGINNQQMAQIPNLKVSSGSTTITGNGSVSNALISPTDNQPFNIEIDQGASLSLDNNSSNSSMFSNAQSNPYQINNSGIFNLGSSSGKAAVFGSGVTGVDLNNNSSGILNLTTAGAIFDSSTMENARVNMDLASGSQTILASKNNAPFSNSNPWASNSLIKFHPNARFVAYSGLAYPAGGLTNYRKSDIPVQFVDSGAGTNGYKTNRIPTNTNAYADLTPISSEYNVANKIISSNDLDAENANALAISGQLAFSDTNPKYYNWNYALNQLPTKASFLARTGGDNLKFNVIDSRASDPNFKINAAYTPNQTNQPFSMWFVNQQQQTQLNQTSQPILNGKEMDKNGANYQKDFPNNQGLLIKADNKAKAGQYSGIVDWTLLNGL